MITIWNHSPRSALAGRIIDLSSVEENVGERGGAYAEGSFIGGVQCNFDRRIRCSSLELECGINRGCRRVDGNAAVCING